MRGYVCVLSQVQDVVKEGHHSFLDMLDNEEFEQFLSSQLEGGVLESVSHLQGTMESDQKFNLTTAIQPYLASASETFTILPSLTSLLSMNDEFMNASSQQLLGNLSHLSIPTFESIPSESTESSILLAIKGLRSYATYEELELLGHNWQVFLTILYILTSAVALFGNIMAIYVLTFGKRSSKGTLRFFLINLSLSDITMAAFSIPFTYTDFMLGRWIFWPWLCPVAQGMQTTSVFVSVYTLTAIGIDRYVAILHPLRSGHFSRIFLPITLPIIWLAGSLMGAVAFGATIARPAILVGSEINHECKETWTDQGGRIYTVSIILLTFVFPMVILSFTYGSIAKRLSARAAPGNVDAARDRAQQAAKVKTLKMLATTVILFGFCWLPLHIVNFLISFARDFLSRIYQTPTGANTYIALIFTAHWLSMANSFVNPVIYSFMSENFRSDLRLFLRRCHRSKSLNRSSTNGRSQQTTSTRVNSRTSRTSYVATSSVRTVNYYSTAPIRLANSSLKAKNGATSLPVVAYRQGATGDEDGDLLVTYNGGGSGKEKYPFAGKGTEASQPLITAVTIDEIDEIELLMKGNNGIPFGSSVRSPRQRDEEQPQERREDAARPTAGSRAGPGNMGEGPARVDRTSPATTPSLTALTASRLSLTRLSSVQRAIGHPLEILPADAPVEQSPGSSQTNTSSSSLLQQPVGSADRQLGAKISTCRLSPVAQIASLQSESNKLVNPLLSSCDTAVAPTTTTTITPNDSNECSQLSVVSLEETFCPLVGPTASAPLTAPLTLSQ